MKPLFRLLVVLFLLSGIVLISCDDSVSSDCPEDQRTGAKCKDGTTTSATGSGACSGHGGVDYWLCN